MSHTTKHLTGSTVADSSAGRDATPCTRRDAAGLPALEVHDLRKSYRGRPALAGVDLTVRPGEVRGLLGPNGAGKTTLVSIVAGLLRADSGSVRVGGIDGKGRPAEARRLIGLAPQDTAVYPTLSVRDNLRYFGGLAGLRGSHLGRRIDEVAGALGLDQLLGRRGSQLSGGERRRLHTAMALVHRPLLALLDEPTTGADVTTRHQLLAFVRGLAAEGSAVVYTTHYLNEVEELGADIAFLDRGRIVAEGDPGALIADHGASALELTFDGPVPGSLRDEGASVDGAVLRITTRDPAGAAAGVLRRMGPGADRLVGIQVVRPSLESVFAAVTGRRYEPEDSEPAA